MAVTFVLLYRFGHVRLSLSIGWLLGQVTCNTKEYSSNYFSSFSPNVDFTIALLPAGIVPLIVFCGYIVNVDYIPTYIKPLRYLSWYSHLNELLQVFLAPG